MSQPLWDHRHSVGKRSNLVQQNCCVGSLSLSQSRRGLLFPPAEHLQVLLLINMITVVRNMVLLDKETVEIIPTIRLKMIDGECIILMILGALQCLTADINVKPISDSSIRHESERGVIAE